MFDVFLILYIFSQYFKWIQVLFGGGRNNFLRVNDTDYKDNRKKGNRVDNRNLIKEWEEKMTNKNIRHKFIWNYTDFTNLNPKDYDKLLGN